MNDREHRGTVLAPTAARPDVSADSGTTSRMEVPIAGGTIDKAKGRAKEAAGALAGDLKLKSEGKLDQAAGKMKDAIDRVSDKAKRALRGNQPKRSR